MNNEITLNHSVQCKICKKKCMNLITHLTMKTSCQNGYGVEYHQLKAESEKIKAAKKAIKNSKRAKSQDNKTECTIKFGRMFLMIFITANLICLIINFSVQ